MHRLERNLRNGLVALGILITGSILAAPTQIQAAGNQSFMVYYRAWRDKLMNGVNTSLPDANPQSMTDIPYGIDIVNVFSYVPAGEEAKAKPFFDALKTTYAPALHQRGVKLVRALGYGGLLDIRKQYGNNPTPEQFDSFAKQLVDTLSTQYDLDGIDIDMEDYPSAADIKLSDGVINAMSKLLGPKANNGTLLIYDTNGSNMGPFQNVKDDFNFVGYQQYGSTSSRTAKAVSDYAKVGYPGSQFLAGLTFPEEGDHNRWLDTNPDNFNASHMHDVATYVNQNNLGGMFVYAVDRDGRTYGDFDLNHIVPTTYRWTKTAILESKGYTLDQVKVAARQHIDRVKGAKNWTADQVAQLEKAITDAQDIFQTVSVFMSDDYSTSIDPSFDAVYEILNPLVDKTALNAAIAKAAALNAGDYTNASWQALTSALNAAKQVNADQTASQTQIDTALKALNTALAGLVLQPTTPPSNVPSIILESGTLTIDDITGKGVQVWNDYTSNKKPLQLLSDGTNITYDAYVVTTSDGTWYRIGTNQWVSAADVALGQATVDALQAVVKTIDATQVFSTFGNNQKKVKVLNSQTSWKVFRQAIDAEGTLWYNLGGHQWIKASDVTVTSTTTPLRGVVTINYVPGYGIAMYNRFDANRHILTRKLAHASRWQVFQKTTTANGSVWYNLGGNQWIPAQYAVLTSNH